MPHALFTPWKLGAFSLAHRVVLPAMACGRAQPHGVPGEWMRQHYVRRATPGGLLVTEATRVDAAGHDDGQEPGLYSPEQVNAWRRLTGEVHGRGAVALAQLALDAAPPRDALGWTAALDIDATLRLARDGAECAGDAGFDGVELLGSLPQRLFDPRRNGRADEFSGATVHNRVRLLLDMVHTLAGVWPADRIGVRLSAVGDDAQLQLTLAAAVAALFHAGVAYVHLGPPWPGGAVLPAGAVAASLAAIRSIGSRAPGVLIASGGFDLASATAAIDNGWVQAVAFGRAFMANPDLPERLARAQPLAPWTGEAVAGDRALVNAPASAPEALRCEEGPWSPDPR